MSLDHESWGTLAAFGPEHALVRSTDLVVSREDACATLGRDPDFQDQRTVSWGRVSLEEAHRLASREPDAELDVQERLALVRELYGSTPGCIVTLYYTDPRRGD